VTPDLETLREAFAERDPDAAPRDDCPSSTLLWGLARGELTSEASDVVDHVATCAVCAESLRLALALGEKPQVVANVRPLVPVWGWGVLGAAAALVILCALPTRDPDVEPAYRSALEEPLLEPRVPAAMRPDEFVLRWSTVEGAVYDVRVATDELDVLMEAHDLDHPELEVPAELLAEVPSGSVLLWQVESRLLDGRVIVSPTFATRVE
jgi:hypothetical protein